MSCLEVSIFISEIIFSDPLAGKTGPELIYIAILETLNIHTVMRPPGNFTNQTSQFKRV